MRYLLTAIQLASNNVKQGGRPFASVIVKSKKIIATGLNVCVQTKDPTAHAEIMAIREASKLLKSESLKGCKLYTTSEPCPMCLGALYWAELDKVIFALPGKKVAQYYYATRRYHHPENFYSQYALPFAQRKLPMLLEERPEALELFKLWKKLNLAPKSKQLKKITTKKALHPEDIIADGVDTGEFHGLTVRKGTIKAAIENAKIVESKKNSVQEKKTALAMIKKLVPYMVALELDRYLTWKNKEIQDIFDKLKPKK